MTGPLRPSTCARCGQPVLPDTRMPGVWVDQRNGRNCWGNPQAPHVGGQAQQAWTPYPGMAQVPGPPKPGGRKVALLVGGGVALAALVVGVVLVLTLGGSSGGNDAQASAPAAPPKSSAPAEQPGAPVPCDPSFKGGEQCFPPEVNGQQVLDRVAQQQQWPCHKQGEQDEGGNRIDEVGVCHAANNVDQPYGKSVDIGYNTDTRTPAGTMKELTISASTSARANKGETTDPQKTSDLAFTALDIAVSNLWPDRPDLRKSAKDTFTQVQDRCLNHKARTMDDLKMPMALGYEVRCSTVEPISVGGGSSGTVTTITEIISIETPLSLPR
jgi:hypothetical protein